jgi:hypothetical protein
MGMTMTLYAVRDETRRRLLANPPLVWRLIAPDDMQLYESARAEFRRKKGGFWARLFGGGASADTAEAPFALGEGEGLVADLDKAWHGVHYLLTGSDEEGNPPMDFLMADGTLIGDLDVGYGPARAFAPEEVAAIAAGFATVTDVDLLARYDGRAMSALEIYPDIWGLDADDDSSREYLHEHLVVLRLAVAEAARRRFALIAVLS